MTNNPQAEVSQITIKVSGTNLTPAEMNLLYLAEVETTLDLPSMFMLRFYDDDFVLMDNAKFKLGAEIQISMGVNDPLSLVFTGEVTALEPDFGADSVAQFVVRGYDKRHRLLKAHTQTFLNMTDSDIVSKLAKAAGLATQTVTSTSVVREHVFQDNQTDLSFMQMLAERNGFELVISTDGKLSFRQPLTADPVELKWRENLRSFRPRVSLVDQVGSVEVRSWDRMQKRSIVATGSPSSSIPAIGGSSMASENNRLYPSSKYVETRVPVETQTDGTNLAKALAAHIGVSFAEAEGVAFGNPALLPGVRVKIINVGTRFGGTYSLSSTRHLYTSAEGYDTHFTIEGTQPQQVADLVAGNAPRSSTWFGVVPAIVTDTVDPKKINRVKVKFPTLTEEHSSTWAPVVAPGAGPNRGIQWFPEVNDEVLVAFESGDINHPYVLGGIWNGKDAPPEPTPVDSAKTRVRIFKTRVGHVLKMVDEDKAAEKKGIYIIDSSGNNKITIDTTTNKITIESQGDIEVKATKNIALNATGNVDIKGRAVNVEAQSTLDLKATGPANLKGAVVNIN